MPRSASIGIWAGTDDKQLLTYLKLTNMPVGLLINFGAATLRERLHRIVNGLPASASPRLRVNQAVPDTSAGIRLARARRRLCVEMTKLASRG
jgi:hypothetical protein